MKLLTKLLAVAVFAIAAFVGASRWIPFVSSIQMGQLSIEPQAELRERMDRIQAVGEKTNDHLFSRTVFIATITEIRKINESDTVIGTNDDANKLVAILRIHAGRLGNRETIAESSVIAIPVGESAEIWNHMLNQKTQYLFEYTRMGRKEYVWKFGC